jgi:hypothetical protein
MKKINCNGVNAIDFVAKQRFSLHPRFKNRGFRVRSAIKNCLVTGGAGFLSKALKAKILSDCKYKII